MELALLPGGKGMRVWQCFNCDGPDPIASDSTLGWLSGELANPDKPKKPCS